MVEKYLCPLGAGFPSNVGSFSWPCSTIHDQSWQAKNRKNATKLLIQRMYPHLIHVRAGPDFVTSMGLMALFQTPPCWGRSPEPSLRMLYGQPSNHGGRGGVESEMGTTGGKGWSSLKGD